MSRFFAAFALLPLLACGTVDSFDADAATNPTAVATADASAPKGKKDCELPVPDPQINTAQPVALAAGPVARVVFVDQTRACACTLKRVEAAWTTLQSAASSRPNLSVERIHVDTEIEKARPYREMRAMQVAPALYFLNSNGELVEMLQGELTATALEGVFQKAG